MAYKYIERFETDIVQATPSYGVGSFTGAEGVYWEYGMAQIVDGYPIDNQGIMLRRKSDSFLKATFANGLGRLSFDYRRAFTGTIGRQLKVEIIKDNAVVRTGYSETFGTDDTVYTFIMEDINIDGEVEVLIGYELPTSATLNAQVTIDNFQWDEPGGSKLVELSTPYIDVNNFEKIENMKFKDKNELQNNTDIEPNTIYFTNEKKVQEAPEDGKSYVRKDKDWVEMVEDGGAEISPNGIDYIKDPDKTYVVIKTNDTFTLFTGDSGSTNYTIEWGDGNSDYITDRSDPSHEYATAGMYLITISGVFDNGIMVGGEVVNVNKDKIIEVYGGSNYPLTIGQLAFHRCTSLTTVNFPNATSIENSAFRYCSSLTTVSFSKVTSIESHAFRNCTNLTTVSFPSATTMGETSFSYCDSLTTANFPNVTHIKTSAFEGCPSLITANFPNATIIGYSAFNGCTSLTTASFPNVEHIQVYAFQYCISLKELTIGRVTATDNGSRFEDVKLINLKIAQDVDTTDIDRIKQFYSDNGGEFTGAVINSI